MVLPGVGPGRRPCRRTAPGARRRTAPPDRRRRRHAGLAPARGAHPGKLLRHAGVDCRLVELDGAEHGFTGTERVDRGARGVRGADPELSPQPCVREQGSAMNSLGDAEVAWAAAEAGAEVVRAAYGRPVTRHAKSGIDFATDTDLDAERAILAVIAAARPGDAVLGEETGETGGPGSRRWLVDPLCGTLNFAAQTPLRRRQRRARRRDGRARVCGRGPDRAGALLERRHGCVAPARRRRRAAAPVRRVTARRRQLRRPSRPPVRRAAAARGPRVPARTSGRASCPRRSRSPGSRPVGARPT